MLKHTFHYCATHKEDEKYMQYMCSQGWAATKLIEGFWTFEPCEPNKYYFKICYLRGLKQSDIENLKAQYSLNGIKFVAQYSFWAIFRSTKEFEIYNKSQELEICKKIYSPMPIGIAISLIIFLISLYLSYKISILFLILTFITLIYGAICIYLALGYKKLINKLS